jgi:peptidoglycan hydrolase-like amidase
VVKKELNSDSWQKAVRDTSGVVLTRGGGPIKAWYSSTHGGYSFTSGDIGWNSTDWTKRLVDATGSIDSFSDLFSKSYDRASPWFYCDWGSRSQYNKTAWLRPEELADIVNVLLLAKRDSSTQSHLVQMDKPNPDGVETWDASRVRSELSSRGGKPYANISDVSISWEQATGRTTQVVVTGNGSSDTFDGNEFKTYFNLRAPATIQIVGPLYNAEKR